MATITTNTETTLENLSGEDLLPTRFDGTGFEFAMGELRGIQTVIPIIDVVKLSVDQVIKRQNYTLEGIEPGQRIISDGHVKKIKDGLRKHADKLLMGTFILATKPQSVKISTVTKTAAGEADIALVKFGVRSGDELFILDAQHRNKALHDLWEEVLEAVASGDLDAAEVHRLLRKSSVPVLIVLEGDRNEISRMFVTLASTKPISPSLVAVMDRNSLPNRLGLEVAMKSELLGKSERLAYQTSTATKETLYAAAAVRGAAASVFIGFRDRTPEIREQMLERVIKEELVHRGDDPEDNELQEKMFQELVAEVVELFDYAYERIPGWHELSTGEIKASEFRSKYVHGSAAGFYVIAGVICAARIAPGIDPKEVIDALASQVEWEKNALVSSGNGAYHHPSFEGTLIVSEAQVDENNEITGWSAKTGGGNRTAYEKAARHVLETLKINNPKFEELTSPLILGVLGLSPRQGEKRGRPAKIVSV